MPSPAALQSEADLMRDNEGLVRTVINDLLRKSTWYRRIAIADLRQAGRMGMLIGIRTLGRRDSSQIKLSTWLGRNIEWTIRHQYGGRAAKDPIWHAWPIYDCPDPRDVFEEIDEIDDRLEARLRVAEALRFLDSRRASALCLRHGIGYDCEKSLRDVARHLGVTAERARQIIIKGECIIRDHKSLKPYRREAWEGMQERRSADQDRLTRMRIAN